MHTLKEFCKLAGTYLQAEQITKIQQAYQFSAHAHMGQHRISGEPYIHHPLEVAYLLAEMHMDHQTLIAALLHDVIEDTPTAKDKIKKQFGKGVAELVDGVSKLSRISFQSHAEAQAHNFRKMIMAMSHDIRVILIKLVDRLHNMRTLDALKPEKRRRIARETLEIYAPITLRLGINSIRIELENLGFASLYPMRYRILAKHVKRTRGNRKTIIQKIRNALKRRMRQEKIPGQIIGREKNLYGIYCKMREQRIAFSEIYDVYAYRIIVDDVDTCYRLVGTVHNLYKPIPGKFKDYIALPKANGYQSLHTILFGPFSIPIEIQIRTRDMDSVAESGIAAHWLYKSSDLAKRIGAHRRAREWLRNIVELQKTAGDPKEFFEHVKFDLFPDNIYVFTPKGKIIELPRGATTVDFAYAIHTDVGNSCIGAKIDRKYLPLGTVLSTGQRVEVITISGARPNPAWLNFVVTARARGNIRHYLKNLKNTDAAHLGKRLLDRELEVYDKSYQDIHDDHIQQLLKKNHIENETALLQEIGLGNQMPAFIAKELSLLADEPGRPAMAIPQTTERQTIPLQIKGTEGMVVSFPKCCHPIPGDAIYGMMTAGRGIVVHRRICKNVMMDFNKHPEKWIQTEWEENIKQEFQACITLQVYNQRGMLATISATIADAEANISNITVKDEGERYMMITFTIEISDRKHLADVIRQVRRIRSVSQLKRC